jgi:antitoxin component of MazEF toxin-antitoxin module
MTISRAVHAPNKAQLAGESANIQIPYFITLRAGMLAKRTSKNQVTLPKAVVQQVGEADYYDVTAQEGKIILTPVRLQQADAVRTKLDELGIAAADIDDAIAWARRRP